MKNDALEMLRLYQAELVHIRRAGITVGSGVGQPAPPVRQGARASEDD